MDNSWRTSPALWARLKPLARQMRCEPTLAEQRLWQYLRRHQLGVKFRRQHVIDRFIVDFYAREVQLIIEVDGPIHQYSVEEDQIRQEFLESLGLRVLRFSNDMIFEAMPDVLAAIRTAVRTTP